jgi:glutamate N-acetyltransferase/amino-acid N-acetyltransferase
VAQVIPASTGVIGVELDPSLIVNALPRLIEDLTESRFPDVSHAIMTTDLVPKEAFAEVPLKGGEVQIAGMTKGSGMIHPRMATTLGFVLTDARVSPVVLRGILARTCERSYNRLSVDGDTSTNDTLLLVASCRAGNPEIIGEGTAEFGKLCEAITEVAQILAQAIVRDGEGATKFITIHVDEAGTRAEAMRVAKSIANSPLVKTAFFASDPNLGRILAAVGNAGIADLDSSRVGLQLGAVTVVENGGRAASYTEEQGKAMMKPAEIAMRVTLGRGVESATAWTCDFSYDYVKINADYRS